MKLWKSPASKLGYRKVGSRSTDHFSISSTPKGFQNVPGLLLTTRVFTFAKWQKYSVVPRRPNWPKNQQKYKNHLIIYTGKYNRRLIRFPCFIVLGIYNFDCVLVKRSQSRASYWFSFAEGHISFEIIFYKWNNKMDLMRACQNIYVALCSFFPGSLTVFPKR